MSGIASLLLDLGYQVSGSDRSTTVETERLQNAGLEFFCPHTAESVAGAGVVVYSSAIKPGRNVAYDAASDTLILSDVGDMMSTSDGAIFVIAAASTADDQVQVAASIRGDATKLGNPVDLAFDGANIYVAEKSNSAVLRYDAILGYTDANNTAEDATIEVTNAESVQLALTKP